MGVEEKYSDDKVLVVKKPKSMIAKLAEKRKELSLLATSSTQKSDQEKTELRKKFKEKFLNEEKITEKVLNMALESVFYDEEEKEMEEKPNIETEQIVEENMESENNLNGVMENVDEPEESKPSNESAVDAMADPAVETSVDAHDELDFEAEEPEK